MSYDLRLAVKVEDTDIFAVIAEPERHSPTYNLGLMFRACTGWDYKQGEFYRVSDVLPKIERGISELKFNRREYVKYEPENGFGTIESALAALESLLECIRENIEGGCTWNEIPLDKLYVAW